MPPPAGKELFPLMPMQNICARWPLAVVFAVLGAQLAWGKGDYFCSVYKTHQIIGHVIIYTWLQILTELIHWLIAEYQIVIGYVVKHLQKRGVHFFKEKLILGFSIMWVFKVWTPFPGSCREHRHNALLLWAVFFHILSWGSLPHLGRDPCNWCRGVLWRHSKDTDPGPVLGLDLAPWAFFVVITGHSRGQPIWTFSMWRCHAGKDNHTVSFEFQILVARLEEWGEFWCPSRSGVGDSLPNHGIWKLLIAVFFSCVAVELQALAQPSWEGGDVFWQCTRPVQAEQEGGAFSMAVLNRGGGPIAGPSTRLSLGLFAGSCWTGVGELLGKLHPNCDNGAVACVSRLCKIHFLLGTCGRRCLGCVMVKPVFPSSYGLRVRQQISDLCKPISCSTALKAFCFTVVYSLWLAWLLAMLLGQGLSHFGTGTTPRLKGIPQCPQVLWWRESCSGAFRGNYWGV